MKLLNFITTLSLIFILSTVTSNVRCQINNNVKKDTILNDSYDNFKAKPNFSPSYVIVKSKATGIILYEHSLENGKCPSCYDRLTYKADSCYNAKNYPDAVVLYKSAFILNENKGKVKHRLNAACSQVKLNEIDNAFENLNKVVFGAKFYNLNEIAMNECFKPLQKESRWTKLIEEINKNLYEIQLKLKAEMPIEQ